MNITWLIIIFAILNLLLTVVCVVLWRRYQAQKAIFENKQRARQERELFIWQSLRTLAMVGIERQCDHAETCLRINGLVDSLGPAHFSECREEIDFFKQFAAQVEGFSRGDSRLRLTLQQRVDQDKKRILIEQNNDASFRRHLKTFLGLVEAKLQQQSHLG